eukprot:g13080.t1
MRPFSAALCRRLSSLHLLHPHISSYPSLCKPIPLFLPSQPSRFFHNFPVSGAAAGATRNLNPVPRQHSYSSFPPNSPPDVNPSPSSSPGATHAAANKAKRTIPPHQDLSTIADEQLPDNLGPLHRLARIVGSAQFVLSFLMLCSVGLGYVVYKGVPEVVMNGRTYEEVMDSPDRPRGWVAHAIEEKHEKELQQSRRKSWPKAA